MFLFWFMLASILIVPVTMILFGFLLKNNPPREINKAYGYRTALSSKNSDIWIFANKLCGRLWVKIGTSILPFSVIFLLFFAKSSENVIGIVGCAIIVAQCLALVLTIPIIEKRLKETFDERGIRKKADEL